MRSHGLSSLTLGLVLGLAACAAAAQSAPGDSPDPQELARTFHSIHVSSTTGYLQPDMLEVALQKRSEFNAWKLYCVRDPNAAEVEMVINRPVLTFDWTFVVTDRRTSAVLLSGKVVAWDQVGAAPAIAQKFVDYLKEKRPLPKKAEAEETEDK